LPHGEKARCIDRILDFAPGKQVRAAWRPHAASPLFDPDLGALPAWSGIEIMAQCAGLYLGMMRRSSPASARPHSGFLVGVRRFRAHHVQFPLHAELTLEADCDEARVEAGELGLFECRILCGDTMYADAHLMLWCAGDETGEA